MCVHASRFRNYSVSKYKTFESFMFLGKMKEN